MNPAISILKVKREEARKCLLGLLKDNSGDLAMFTSLATQFTATTKAIRVLEKEGK